MPPWPGNSVPESFTPAWRLIRLSNRSPTIEATTVSSASATSASQASAAHVAAASRRAARRTAPPASAPYTPAHGLVRADLRARAWSCRNACRRRYAAVSAAQTSTSANSAQAVAVLRVGRAACSARARPAVIANRPASELDRRVLARRRRAEREMPQPQRREQPPGHAGADHVPARAARCAAATAARTARATIDRERPPQRSRARRRCRPGASIPTAPAGTSDGDERSERRSVGRNSTMATRERREHEGGDACAASASALSSPARTCAEVRP